MTNKLDMSPAKMGGNPSFNNTKHSENLEVRHESSAKRFAVRLGNQIAYLSYEKRSDKTIDYAHVYVPPEFRNRRIAEKLTKTALDYAGQKGLTVIPSCSYVAAYLKRIKRRQK